MKITKSKLIQIIKEEIANTVKEAEYSQITRQQRATDRNVGVDDEYSRRTRPSRDENIEWMITKLARNWNSLMDLEKLSAEELAIVLKTGQNLKHHSHGWRQDILYLANKDQDTIDKIVDASMNQGMM